MVKGHLYLELLSLIYLDCNNGNTAEMFLAVMWIFIFCRYSADFGQEKDILKWIMNYLDATKAGLLTHLLGDGGPVNIVYQSHDWSLNSWVPLIWEAKVEFLLAAKSHSPLFIWFSEINLACNTMHYLHTKGKFCIWKKKFETTCSYVICTLWECEKVMLSFAIIIISL